MSVIIGHASIGETGNAKNNKAGDQTSKEVCIRNWYEYKGGWSCVLRPKDKNLAKMSAFICTFICNSNKVGYDQNQRNTLWTQYLKHKDLAKIEDCETDCSAFMTFCAILGGANIEYGSNAPTTRTMRKIFGNSGDYEVLTDSVYTKSSDYLKIGDILLSEGHHTVMVLSDGDKANETNTKNLTLAKPTLKFGSKGENVKTLQKSLNILADQKLNIDGDYGNNTKRAVLNVQTFMGLKQDGIYGVDTQNVLKKVAEIKGYKVN